MEELVIVAPRPELDSCGTYVYESRVSLGIYVCNGSKQDSARTDGSLFVIE
jgi:hypothetical protein